MSEQRSVNADRSPSAPESASNEEIAEVRSALRDMANLVNQAISVQALRPRGSTSSAAGDHHHAQDRGRRVLRDFLDQRVPEFAGLPDPMIAEDWMSRMEKAFEVIRCEPTDMVRLAVHRLVGEADHWWKMLKRELYVSVDTLTWEEFQRHFNDKYFPSCVRTRKEAEFMALRQGNMTVAQYEAQFIALSRFAPYLVDTDERKARRFQDGLNDAIQMQLLPFDLEEYGAVLKRAMIIEQALLRRGQIQQTANTPTGDRPQRSFHKKRPNARGQGGGVRCFKCQKTGHLARNCYASSSAPTDPSSFPPAPTSREHQLPRTCFNCGKPGHFIKDCKAPKQGVPGTAGHQRPQRSGRVYAVTEQQARDSPDVVQGGTFALYSLLCRHAKVNTIPNQHRTDEQLTTYSRNTFPENSFSGKTKRWLEGHASRRNALLILVLVGTCMVIGDGILTPAISVLSAAGGIKVDHPKMSNDVVVLVAVVILVGLFSVQHYGTDKVGWLFAPIVLLWFLLIGGIGIFNIWKFDSSVLRAFSPLYVYRYLKRGGRDRWTSLGGIMLSITGTEALFADLGHFPVVAIQIAFTVVVFPCLLLAYSGQAAYLMSHSDDVVDVFYHSIPDSIYWPVFIIATLAAIVASQATISATFSIIKQALALGCFPRVKVVHTSKNFLGQIYIPDINWVLMILCIAVTAGFQNQNQIGNAYGTAVVIVMLATTFLMILVMLLVWRCHWILVLIFTGLSLVVELTYFSAVLFKVDQGGWVPLVIAAAFLLVMYVWHYGTVKRYEFEMQSKVSMAWILGLGPSLGLVRVPGIGLVYTELASGLPRIFSHFITNLPAIHSVVIFVCVKYLPVYTVPEEERFLVKRIGPKNFHMFRCVARYGYKDLHKKDDDFEKILFDNLFLFVRLESMMEGCTDSDEYSLYGQQTAQSKDCLLSNNNVTKADSDMGPPTISSDDLIVAVKSPQANPTMRSSGLTSSQTEVAELEFLSSCRDAGVVHILGNTVVRARRNSSFYKKIAVDYIYAFLRKICRENSVIFNIPHEALLNVGQIFYV